MNSKELHEKILTAIHEALCDPELAQMDLEDRLIFHGVVSDDYRIWRRDIIDTFKLDEENTK